MPLTPLGGGITSRESTKTTRHLEDEARASLVQPVEALAVGKFLRKRQSHVVSSPAHRHLSVTITHQEGPLGKPVQKNFAGQATT